MIFFLLKGIESVAVVDILKNRLNGYHGKFKVLKSREIKPE